MSCHSIITSKEYRKRLGLTQSELASEACIGRNTLQHYEQVNFAGRIDAETQKLIADALHQPLDVIFPAGSATRDMLDRRQLLSMALGVSILGIGLAPTLSPLMGTAFAKRKSLSATELQTLIDENHATWMLLESLQQGTTIDYVNAVASGKLVALSHLVREPLLEQQKHMITILLGDMHILLGRLHRDLSNFALAENHFLTAIQISDESGNADLKTAARHRYTNMLLLDQARPIAASRIAREMLEVSKTASYPLWAEAQLIAGMTFAYTGRYEETRRLATQARHKQVSEPDIWVGNITNPKAIYADFDLITALAVQKFHDVYQASIDAMTLINQEYPAVMHWRLNVETMQAQALWGLGDIEGAIDVATRCLEASNQIDSTVTINRLEHFYTNMMQSQQKKHPAVKRFGEMLLAQ